LNDPRLFSLIAMLVVSGAASAQNPAKPLIWGADPDGGIPYVFVDPENPEKIIGVEVELAEALSRELGRPIQFQSEPLKTSSATSNAATSILP